MKSKPSWPLFLAWTFFYTLLDLVLEYFLHGFLAWSQLPEAIEGALFGAAITGSSLSTAGIKPTPASKRTCQGRWTPPQHFQLHKNTTTSPPITTNNPRDNVENPHKH